MRVLSEGGGWEISLSLFFCQHLSFLFYLFSVCHSLTFLSPFFRLSLSLTAFLFFLSFSHLSPFFLTCVSSFCFSSLCFSLLSLSFLTHFFISSLFLLSVFLLSACLFYFCPSSLSKLFLFLALRFTALGRME